MISASILKQISKALDHQEEKFGNDPLASPFEAGCILVEEVGEFIRAILQNNRAQAEHEAIQVIAVTIAWLQGDLHYDTKA